MALIIECIILCIIFTLIILIPQYKNPITQIMSYPVSIRRRVETLPEYKDIIGNIKNKNIAKKIIGAFIIAIVLSIISYLTGNETFLRVFANTFTVFLIINLYDLIILDIIIFCHSKKLMIKGTEDMAEEYKNPKHHIIGFIKGIGIGLIISLLSGGIIALYNVIK